jgi:hypothetical protein
MTIDPDTGRLVPMFTPAQGEPGLGYRDANSRPNPTGYMISAIQALQYIPGRKAVLLFTHSFAAPPQLMEMANRAGVVIYVIDSHGFEGVVPSGAPYRQLAKQTGGLFLLSSPGDALDRDLVKVLEDISGYYLIGYRPNLGEAELAQGRPARHNIQVKVLRPGLQVRARNGYLGVPETEPTTDPKTAADYLQEAVSAPFSEGQIRMRIEPQYRASTPDPKTKQRGALLRAGLLVDGRDLKLSDTDEARKKFAYSALVLVLNESGTLVAKDGKTFSAVLTSEQASQLPATGVGSWLDIRLPGPGRYQIRAAVRDEDTGSVGSAYTFLEVPDFNQSRLTLSSIELATKEFAAGSALSFRCEVFGFRMRSQPPHDAQVEMQVIVYREGEERPQSHTAVLPAAAASLADHYLAGRLETAGLPAGEYMMQLTAWDRLAPARKQPAVQSTHFRVTAAR